MQSTLPVCIAYGRGTSGWESEISETNNEQKVAHTNGAYTVFVFYLYYL